MTSSDTLGYGATANIAPTVFPSATINASIPDENGIPKPWNARVSSVEAGAGLSGFAGTYTTTPRQMADFLNKYIFGPAMGPNDELHPFVRSLQSGVGTIGQNDGEPPTRFLSSQTQNPFGSAMAGWTSSVDPSGPQYLPQPTPSPDQPGGLPGMLLDYLRNNLAN